MKIVILGSGLGSNAEAILKAQHAGRLGSARTMAIVSDKPQAPILKLGPRFGIPADAIDPGCFNPQTELSGNIGKLSGFAYSIAYIRRFQPDLIVLAGFMRIVPPDFIRAFHGRVLNLHPSLLPAFPGLNSIGQAFKHGVKYTGCTVHWVTPEVDAGPIIDQAVVPIENNDTLDTLEAKVHAAEHRLLPEVIARLSRDLSLLASSYKDASSAASPIPPSDIGSPDS